MGKLSAVVVTYRLLPVSRLGPYDFAFIPFYTTPLDVTRSHANWNLLGQVHFLFLNVALNFATSPSFGEAKTVLASSRFAKWDCS